MCWAAALKNREDLKYGPKLNSGIINLHHQIYYDFLQIINTTKTFGAGSGESPLSGLTHVLNYKPLWKGTWQRADSLKTLHQFDEIIFHWGFDSFCLWALQHQWLHFFLPDGHRSCKANGDGRKRLNLCETSLLWAWLLRTCQGI